jgi:hypothetical protein
LIDSLVLVSAGLPPACGVSDAIRNASPALNMRVG